MDNVTQPIRRDAEHIYQVHKSARICKPSKNHHEANIRWNIENMIPVSISDCLTTKLHGIQYSEEMLLPEPKHFVEQLLTPKI